MLHAHDLLTLCLEEFIIRATRLYVECRSEMADAPRDQLPSLKRAALRHRASIEKLVALRASIISERPAGTAPTEIAAVTNKKRRVRLQHDRVLPRRRARGSRATRISARNHSLMT